MNSRIDYIKINLKFSNNPEAKEGSLALERKEPFPSGVVVIMFSYNA